MKPSSGLALIALLLVAAGCNQEGDPSIASAIADPLHSGGDNIVFSAEQVAADAERARQREITSVDGWLRSYGQQSLPAEERARLRDRIISGRELVAPRLHLHLAAGTDLADPILRVGAIAASPLVADDTTVTHLRRILREDPTSEARRNALVALFTIAPPDILDDVRTGFSDDIDAVYVCAAQLAATHPEAAALLELIASDDIKMRRGAMLLAGFIGHPAADPIVPAIRARLDAEHWVEVAHAADALRRLEDRAAVPSMIANFARFPEANVTRGMLVEALAALDDGSQADRLIIDSLPRETDSDVGLRMIWALGAWRTEAAIDTLAGALESTALHPDVRAEAALMLAECPGETASLALACGHLDEKLPVRDAVLKARALRGDLTAIDLADALLDEPLVAGTAIAILMERAAAGKTLDDDRTLLPLVARQVRASHVPMESFVELAQAMGGITIDPASPTWPSIQAIASPWHRRDSKAVAEAYVSALQRLCLRATGFFAGRDPQETDREMSSLRREARVQLPLHASFTLAGVEVAEDGATATATLSAGEASVPLSLVRDEWGEWRILDRP